MYTCVYWLNFDLQSAPTNHQGLEYMCNMVLINEKVREREKKRTNWKKKWFLWFVLIIDFGVDEKEKKCAQTAIKKIVEV